MVRLRKHDNIYDASTRKSGRLDATNNGTYIYIKLVIRVPGNKSPVIPKFECITVKLFKEGVICRYVLC